MKIFLSYSSRDRTKAEEIALALQAQKHDVFFDKDELSGGEDFNAVIRGHIAKADMFVFLISPESVRPGGYTLTELRLAREKWASPKKHVLPVLLEPTDMETIPAYLRGVTIFQAEGNVAAEVAAHFGSTSRRRQAFIIGGVAVVVIIFAFFLYPYVQSFIFGGKDPLRQEQLLSDFVGRYVYQANEIKRTEYSLDPNSSFPPDSRDVVTLEKITFGWVSQGYNAFNIIVAVTNTSARPILLDLTQRFFDLKDDRGRKAELLYFCCKASGETLGPSQQMQIQLLYRLPPGWQGKNISAKTIYFRISGLLPLLQGTWEFPPLPTVD